MADEDKDKSKPIAPSVKDILDRLRSNSPLSNKVSGPIPGIPKPMILGTLPPKTLPGPPNFTDNDVNKMLKDLGVITRQPYEAQTGTKYIDYKRPDNFPRQGEASPTIRVSQPNDLHAGRPNNILTPDSPSNFVDTSGMDEGVRKRIPSEYRGKFTKNEAGEYFNNLDVLRNFIIKKEMLGLTPPGSGPSKVDIPQPVVRLPPDPNQMSFMDKGLLENYGKQKSNSVLGGNQENLWHSGQMGQRFNLDTPKDFGVGSMYAMPMPANREPPIVPGLNPGQQQQMDANMRALLKLLSQSKETPPDAAQ
jgi:hypothetical protein